MKNKTFIRNLLTIALMLSLFVLLPSKPVYAAKYTIPGTDITIDLPDGVTVPDTSSDKSNSSSYEYYYEKTVIKITVNGQTKYYTKDKDGNLIETDKDGNILNNKDKKDTTTEKTKKVKNGWITEKGKKYYYKNNKKITGMQKIGKYTFYFNKKGVMQKNKIIKIKGKVYAFNKKGHMVKNKSYTGKLDGKKVTYFFGKDGVAIWKAI